MDTVELSRGLQSYSRTDFGRVNLRMKNFSECLSVRCNTFYTYSRYASDGVTLSCEGCRSPG